MGLCARLKVKDLLLCLFLCLGSGACVCFNKSERGKVWRMLHVVAVCDFFFFFPN